MHSQHAVNADNGDQTRADVTGEYEYDQKPETITLYFAAVGVENALADPHLCVFNFLYTGSGVS